MGHALLYCVFLFLECFVVFGIKTIDVLLVAVDNGGIYRDSRLPWGT